MQSGPIPPHPPQPPQGSPFPHKRTSSSAVPALVLGIIGLLSLPLAGFCCPVISAPFSILALVLGLQSKREIAADPTLEGAGQAQAGYVLGIIGLVLAALVVILLVAVLGVGIASSDS